MARRKSSNDTGTAGIGAETENAVEEQVPETLATPIWFTDHLVPRRAKTRDDVLLLDAVSEAQRRSEKLVRDFVEEQIAAGYSVSDLNTLYSVERALIPTLEELDGGRVRVRLDTRIIEREDADDGEPDREDAA